MRKKLTVYGLLVVGLISAVVWFYHGSVPGGAFSARDVLAIKRAIRQETSEPILRIDGDGDGIVTVRTGRIGNGLDGSGHDYRLNRTASGWQIVGRSVWMSALPNKTLQATAATPRSRTVYKRPRRHPAAVPELIVRA